MWNSYGSAPESVLGRIDFVDEKFKARLRDFSLVKRNPNDAYALNRLFATLSVEFQRFKSGALSAAVQSIGRLNSNINAAKKEAARLKAAR